MVHSKHVKPRLIVTPRIITPGGTSNLWLLVVGLLGLVLWSWQMFEAGRGWAGYDFERSHAEESALKARIDELDATVAHLRLQAASNGRASQIDRDAVRQAQVSLAKLEAERAELSQEVALLRGLLSTGRGPLHVRDFHLEAQADGQVQYRFTVAQALRNIGMTVGVVYVQIAGKGADGKRHKLKLSQVSADGQSVISVRFMHYQDIEGLVRLPDGFQPESITIRIRPKTKGLKRVTRVFQWQLDQA
jgi:hypothetical protein